MTSELASTQSSEEPVAAPPVHPRVPHFGHVLLFLVLAATMLFVAQALVVAAVGTSSHDLMALVQNQRLQLATMTIGYLLTLLACWFLFTRMWERPFLEGIQWNGATALRHAPKLIPIGFVLGWSVQAVESLITLPSSIPMDEFFKNASVVWALTVFGTLLAPMFEEIAFRGFLFPALAIAWDWTRLKRTPESYAQWRSTDTLSTEAVLISGLVSSAIFALIHAAQLGYTWAAVAVLMVVSLALTWVRVRLRSVAASALVHSCYNLSVFITLMISTGGYRHLERMAQ
ncbi:CPBP family intramembrane metalloprotease [Granulicella sp. WH15]|uniref:CPBP family intramembrane glutamic endopeptidase n=1 Tax=Granulicella sp. WH15 TaxID=2602070 RepID=UPI00136780C9|nr:CPBP family intramembrane glutamic endopeptidase [Granulicella sp. WH15]QHN03830.1 CPBP family intramembrane metalloprotease [Granulicella sp. WH15]